MEHRNYIDMFLFTTAKFIIKNFLKNMFSMPLVFVITHTSHLP